jgi:penicillin-binding protein 1A
MFLTPERSMKRKAKEALVAIKIEEAYSKEEILTFYLNQVYLGNNVYGMATAAQFYFHVPASKLTLPQAALLAGMIRAPNNYDPLRHPREVFVQRLLSRMIGLGPTSGA